ncbi:M56 family metallopeptidase [Anaerocolumna aminovalerica]|uniref:M56 family metallopeptidase n=1 Tax=Anaerocolumna aminovalerica TaxID=1527 RepID=UPI000BE42545|nr:M56 family metallopeptidase [Anaerocolumna aminovalerica]
MRNFLTTLLQCSLSMSLVTLVYVAILPLLSKRYAAKWRYMVWLAIAAGWIFPFRPHIKLPFLPMQIQKIPVEPMQPIVNIVPSMVNPGAIVTTPSTIPLWRVLPAIWIIGIISAVAYHTLRHSRFMKMVRRWSEPITDSGSLKILEDLKAELDIKAQVELSLCQSITSPMLVGFFHPAILLPAIKTTDNDLYLILKHELIHFQRRDLWCKALILTATTLHWFNPVVYLMSKAAAIQCEISCDELVLQGTDFQQRKQYGETILGIVRNGGKIQTTLSTNFYGGKKGMKNRIFSIMDTKQKKAGVVILCMALAGIIITGATLTAAADKEPAYAFEGNIPLSDREKAKQEQERKEEKAKRYSIYTKFGLNYNQENDRFYYNDQLVRFFADKLDDKDSYNSFSYTEGDVDLRGVRNEKYELIALEPVSQKEYDQRTAKIQAFSESLSEIQESAIQESEMQENVGNESINTNSTAIETGDSNKNINGVIQEKADSNGLTGNGSDAVEAGDPNYVDHSLNAYTKYGISYDRDAEVWMYQDKPIHCLYDNGYTTFIDNSKVALKDGLSLKVIRNSNAGIEQLAEMTEAEVNRLFN